MRILRLHVRDFATIEDADVEFGPGLNVLYGPNDLGKSTLVDAIRLALLLPQTSTHIEDYVAWTGGRDPVVEMTFETEPQRIWRVRKEFRRGGVAVLQESKDGVDFDEVVRGRRVDGKLREILCWGIPEPGGAGGSRGLPTSFLATVLLSTQSEVTAVLKGSLQSDSSDSGRERIAAALEAVAQDPLFAELLRTIQAKRDEGYTDAGAKKTAKGSPFRIAAERLNEARNERDRLQTVVDESEGVETRLRDLTSLRSQREEALMDATERLTTLQHLEAQAADRCAAADEVEHARHEVARIQKIASDVDAAERSVGDLAGKIEAAEEELKTAQMGQAEADTAFKSAQEAAREAASDPAVNDTVARQGLELRKAAAEQALQEAQQRIDAATGAQKLVDAAAKADTEHHAQQIETEKARAALAEAVDNERAVGERLRRIDLLERALDVRSADERTAAARADVDTLGALQARREAEATEREALEKRRAAIVVPDAGALGPMRHLGHDLAAARGALNVGLVVTVTANRPIAVRAKKDGTAVDPAPSGQALEVEANAEVDIDIGDVASVRVRGGRRDAQEIVEALEARWSREVAPHLAAANVTDLEGLSAKIAEAHGLNTSIEAENTQLQSLQVQIHALADSAERLREALERTNLCRAALGDIPYETLTGELAALDPEPTDKLRVRRQQASSDLELARAAASRADTAHTLGQERAGNSGAALDTAVAARDAALAPFPHGLVAALSTAQAALAAALGEQKKIVGELASLERTIRMRNEQVEAAVRDARAAAEQARERLDAANVERTKTIADHALQVGLLEGLRRQRDAEDLAAAADRLRSVTDRYAALPVPERMVTEAEITTAHAAETAARTDLETTHREIERTHGALAQVGGAVARERLRDAVEVFELAERQEREIEADYEAWSLLLEQMKQADAAQASNLGQALAPGIAGRFEELTQRRYENIRLTAQLGTEGVLAAGAVRPTTRISVGTREQLSTLYRLSLAEYLSTAVVLDDQLVQSDDTRMDWFRALLAEKARSFQIVVFTCRPGDYLPANAVVSKGKGAYKDTDGGFVRAVDLTRALGKG
ncbi:MAG TPA: AAA family ATPase [Candidatus Binataceae bacterium]|nr:AAA family ATPase [Candidatus Binataceae bacterium]